MVAVGDLHGNHDKLVRLLTAADLIDRARHWSGGDDHLVVAGDFLDRGVDERPLMDLLRRLETESIAAGGRVHVLLGNHEVMNLFRDLRYVNPQSYRHFEPDERRAERRAAAWKFTRLRGGNWRAATFREFNQRFPPGYFGRLASLDPDGEYGSWLMELPAMVKINGVAYVHGGLNEEFAALGVDGINRRITDQLRRHLEAREVLEDAGVVSPVLATLEVLGAAEEIVESRRGGHGAARRRLAAEQLLAEAADPILGR
ncbi:MAG: metallophosphoesterase, partial [Thermoanaerobaculia bacterium]